jgi:hypothetical protein
MGINFRIRHSTSWCYMLAAAIALIVSSCCFQSSEAHGAARDVSWIQAYNAGFVRVKASGRFASEITKVDPMLFDFVRFVADCPAVPSTFPFPPRVAGTRLQKILVARVVRIAFQFNSTQAKLSRVPGFPQAFVAISTAIVSEISKAYNVPLKTRFIDFPTSDTSVQGLIDGEADVTDPFYRQWSLVISKQVQRRVMATPACTIWAAPISVSWNSTRNNWRTVADLAAAGSKVVIPLYSTVLPFRSEIRALLPKAKFLVRPKQNFEGDRAQFLSVFKEFQRGTTTVLIAARVDIESVIKLYGLSLSNFNTKAIATSETRIVGPVGAFLPLPEAVTV